MRRESRAGNHWKAIAMTKEPKLTQAHKDALAIAMPLIRAEMRVDEWEAFNEFMGNDDGRSNKTKPRLIAIREFVQRLENIATRGEAGSEDQPAEQA